MNEVSKLIDRKIRQSVLDTDVATIRGLCFSYCYFMDCAVIPSSVTSIGDYAFAAADNLNAVLCLAETPPTLGTSVFTDTTCQIYVPAASVDTYKSTTNWSEYASRIQAIPETAIYSVSSSYCEIGQDGWRTENIVVTEKDINPYSPTYNTTRTRTYKDSEHCAKYPYFLKINNVSSVVTGTYLLVDEGANAVLTAERTDSGAGNAYQGLNTHNKDSVNIETIVGYNGIYNVSPDNIYAAGIKVHAMHYDSSTQLLTKLNDNDNYIFQHNTPRGGWTTEFGYYNPSQSHQVTPVAADGGGVTFMSSGSVSTGTPLKLGFDGHFFTWGGSTDNIALYLKVGV